MTSVRAVNSVLRTCGLGVEREATNAERFHEIDEANDFAVRKRFVCGDDRLVTHDGPTYHCDVCSKTWVILPSAPSLPITDPH